MISARLSLGRAHLLATNTIRDARRMGVPADALTPVGGLRRYAPELDEVTLIAVAPPSRHPGIRTAFVKLPAVTAVVADTGTSVTILTTRGQVTLHFSTPEDAGTALVWHTGSSQHLALLADRARHRGLILANGQLTRDGVGMPCTTEAAFYQQLELPFIAPELREGHDEVDAAERGALPQLVSDLHIRGDLHMHSTWSDGRDTLEMMVYAARQLGYEYVAITDHSEHAASSRRLTVDDVPRQRDDLIALRTRVQGIEILHGVEVDIMPDGSLDFSDELLAGFDIVLASLHDRGGHDRERLTERYLAAMHHPLVNVITHPANRSPAQSPGYDLDYERLFGAAVETGTAMEVDGAPGHLDMDGTIARRAVAAGVTVTIDSDCHRAEALGRQMQFGVGTARRGWVEPQHVLNSRSVADVKDFVARKRARR